MTRQDSVIALVLGDAPASPALARWLAGDRGREELAAYAKVLEALARLYGEPAVGKPVVHYCAVPTPIGRLFVAATDAGIVRIAFRQSETAFIGELRRRLGGRPVRSRARTADIVHQLRAYFAGARRAFDVRVDLSGLTPFHRRVLLAAARVPAGQVVSYGEIARRIGRPGSSRAVGQALGRNPVPIVIPCHRIVASGGGLGGYGGGLAIKRKLLRLEGALAATG
jgi:methylated-DNA-[protein]-cysteine S-methyltransferase